MSMASEFQSMWTIVNKVLDETQDNRSIQSFLLSDYVDLLALHGLYTGHRQCPLDVEEI
jgi:hypothetical protein